MCDLYQAECQVSIYSKIIKLLQKLTVLRHFQSLSGKNRKVEKQLCAILLNDKDRLFLMTPTSVSFKST